MTISAIVLAAGKGTRMRSELPKPLHLVCGRPLLAWVIDALADLELDHTAVVVGHGREMVVEALQGAFPGRDFVYAEQLAQRGTGDAAAVGLAELDLIAPSYDDDDHILVLPGDTPLLRRETITELVSSHLESKAACTMLTARVPDPTGYGRVVRNTNGTVGSIVEHRDANAQQLTIDEMNAAMYMFRRSLLSPGLRLISTDNAQGELYLTDVVGILAESGHEVMPLEIDPIETSGVNDRAQLAAVTHTIRAEILTSFMREGVTIVQPSSTVIDAGVAIEPDVVVHANSVLEGSTSIAGGAVIGPNAHLVDAVVGADARVESSTVKGASVSPDTTVGPYEFVTGNESH